MRVASQLPSGLYRLKNGQLSTQGGRPWVHAHRVVYTRVTKKSGLKYPFPHEESKSAVGLASTTSGNVFPAAFCVCTRSLTTDNMSYHFVRLGLSPSGPWPGTIFVSEVASLNALSVAAIMPLILPPVLASING